MIALTIQGAHWIFIVLVNTVVVAVLAGDSVERKSIRNHVLIGASGDGVIFTGRQRVAFECAWRMALIAADTMASPLVEIIKILYMW